MSDPPKKRRLPVLQNNDDDDERRPAAQWIVIGAIAIFMAWYPLAMLASAWAKSSVGALSPEGDQAAAREAFLALSGAERIWLSVVVVVGPMVALAIASLLGGMLVGRFGGEAGKQEGTFAGVAAGVVASLVSAPQMIASNQVGLWIMTAAIITILAGIAGRGGSALGLRARR